MLVTACLHHHSTLPSPRPEHTACLSWGARCPVNTLMLVSGGQKPKPWSCDTAGYRPDSSGVNLFVFNPASFMPTYLLKEWKTAHALGSLTPTEETRMKLLAPTSSHT